MKKTLIIGYGQRGNTLGSILPQNSFDTLDPFIDASTFKSENQLEASNYDKVIISTNEEMKCHYINLAIRNRWNILVEKPLLFSPTQISKWEKEAREEGICISTAYSHKHEKLIEILRKNIEKGNFGEIYEIHVAYLNGTAENIKNSVWRDSKYAVAIDLIPHTIDLIFYLLQNSAINSPKWNTSNFENKGMDSVSLQAKVSTTTIKCDVSYVCWKNTFRLEVFGSKAYGIVNSLEKWGHQSLEIFERQSPPSVPQKILSAEVVEKSNTGIENQWLEFLKNVSNQELTDLSNEKVLSEFYQDSFGDEIFFICEET
jgi:predicted dehydrogenase